MTKDPEITAWIEHCRRCWKRLHPNGEEDGERVRYSV